MKIKTQAEAAKFIFTIVDSVCMMSSAEVSENFVIIQALYRRFPKLEPLGSFRSVSFDGKRTGGTFIAMLPDYLSATKRQEIENYVASQSVAMEVDGGRREEKEIIEISDSDDETHSSQNRSKKPTKKFQAGDNNSNSGQTKSLLPLNRKRPASGYGPAALKKQRLIQVSSHFTIANALTRSIITPPPKKGPTLNSSFELPLSNRRLDFSEMSAERSNFFRSVSWDEPTPMEDVQSSPAAPNVSNQNSSANSSPAQRQPGARKLSAKSLFKVVVEEELSGLQNPMTAPSLQFEEFATPVQSSSPTIAPSMAAPINAGFSESGRPRRAITPSVRARRFTSTVYRTPTHSSNSNSSNSLVHETTFKQKFIPGKELTKQEIIEIVDAICGESAVDCCCSRYVKALLDCICNGADPKPLTNTDPVTSEDNEVGWIKVDTLEGDRIIKSEPGKVTSLLGKDFPPLPIASEAKDQPETRFPKVGYKNFAIAIENQAKRDNKILMGSGILFFDTKDDNRLYPIHFVTFYAVPNKPVLIVDFSIKEKSRRVFHSFDNNPDYFFKGQPKVGKEHLEELEPNTFYTVLNSVDYEPKNSLSANMSMVFALR